jgi:hypothetical protein
MDSIRIIDLAEGIDSIELVSNMESVRETEL